MPLIRPCNADVELMMELMITRGITSLDNDATFKKASSG
jgi:hypothetical protein